MDAGCTETCRCKEYEAKIKAYATQVKALRRGMADGVAGQDAARAERDAARAERDAARAETAAVKEDAEARLGEALSKIASLQAWAELQVGGAWQGGSPVPGAVAAVPSGAYVHDIMSAPPLAVQAALPAAVPAAGEAAAAATTTEAAAAAAEGGEAEAAGQGSGNEESELESLRRQVQFLDNENTPPRSRSLKNKARAKYRATVALARGPGDDDDGCSAEGEDEEEKGECGLAVPAKKRGGQPGHRGGSNNQKAEACFEVLLEECPDCHGADFDKRRPATKRTWDTLSDWVVLLGPRDERARAMIDLAKRLAKEGAQGPCVCVSISFQRRYCRTCDKIVKASVSFLIDGSAIGEVCQAEAHALSERNPDTFVAVFLGDTRGLPLGYDALRTARLERRHVLAPVYGQIEDHIAASPWCARDESGGKGCLPNPDEGKDALPATAAAAALPAATLEAAAEAAVAAAGATSNSHIQYILAAVPDAVLVLVAPSRSARYIKALSGKLKGIRYVSDEFTVYARDGPDLRQTDHPHLLRKSELAAAESYLTLIDAGAITHTNVVRHRRAAFEWGRRVVGIVMGADPSARLRGGEKKKKEEEEPKRIVLKAVDTGRPGILEAVEVEDGDEKAEGEIGAEEGGVVEPLPPFPPMPHLPLSGPAGGGPGSLSDKEAAARRNEIAADAAISAILHWSAKWDTAAIKSELRLQDALRLPLGLYGEDHPVRKAFENAMPCMFSAYRQPGMPLDSTLVERAVRDAVHPDRTAHKHYRCVESAEAASRSTSFNGTCRRRGISPLLAFKKILRNPRWNIFKEGRPPLPPPP